MVRHSFKLVSEGSKMIFHTNEKAPGACNTEGLRTNTNDLNFATVSRYRKAIAMQVAELALRGHAVHPMSDGGYLVCKYGYTFYASDFDALKAFAKRLGVSQ